MSLTQIVELAREHHHRHDYENHEDKDSDDNSGDNSTPRLGQNDHQGTHSTKRNSTQYKSPPTTPSMRTGPPRSLSYTYSLPNSPATSRNNSKMVEQSEPRDILSNGVEEEGQYFPFTRREEFRGVLEYTASSDQSDRKGKKRDSRINDESWNPMRWFSESPKEEKPTFISDEEAKAAEEKAAEHDQVKGDGQAKIRDVEDPGAASEGEAIGSLSSTKLASKLRRASSVPHSPQDKPKPGLANWGRLKSLLPNVVSEKHHAPRTPGPSAVTHHSVNITDELITGGLSTLMLRLWFERDEKDNRRVPVLLHRLRIRVSDSLHPLHGNKSVYRIECEYANGAARWVVHRRLQDFVSLHYHYALSNAYNRNVENLPEFPRTSTYI